VVGRVIRPQSGKQLNTVFAALNHITGYAITVNEVYDIVY
jgi:hypothetical protein